MFIQEHQHSGRRLIVSFSQKRANKDRKDRERLVARIKSKLNGNRTATCNLIGNSGYKKYLIEEKKGEMIFDEEQIVEEAKWDGLHGVITNDTSSQPGQLLNHYRRLWVIEESFMLNKHHLRMRSIYHFSKARIAAHILLCYLAFALSRFVQFRVQIQDQQISHQKMRDALFGTASSLLEDTTTGMFYKMPSQISPDSKTIYRAMGIARKACPSIVSV